MTILCLEGPSAVGKSTLAQVLADRIGARVVPEVNQLYERPADADDAWYLARQQDRWQLAAQASLAGQVAVLDGDVFQPLWYGWAYGFAEHLPLHDLLAFYRPRLISGLMGFPLRYVLLQAGTDELRQRKAHDPTRSRRNFERHLQLVAPLQRYFQALERVCPARVLPLAASSPRAGADTVVASLSVPPQLGWPDGPALLDALAELLSASAV